MTSSHPVSRSQSPRRVQATGKPIAGTRSLPTPTTDDAGTGSESDCALVSPRVM